MMSPLSSKYRLKIELPEGMMSHIEDDKVRFIGTANNLTEFAAELRRFKYLND